jgi:hypothetical protein
MERHHITPVWFFVGVLMTIYGILISASGFAEWAHPPNTVLSQLHAPVWWGNLMTLIGVLYLVAFWPRRSR